MRYHPPSPRCRAPPSLDASPSSKAAAGKMNLYESFAQATQLGDLHTCLMMDMKACQEDDVRLLCYLTPSIYTEVRPGRAPGWLRRSGLGGSLPRSRPGTLRRGSRTA